MPPFTEARLAEAALTDLVPTEYRADAVVLLVDGEPVFGVILEAQLREDPDKRFTWPLYAVSARARHRCPFVVLVVTADQGTARWAAQPVDLGAGTPWRALVVGPEGIPVVTDVARAVREPHLAVLSLIAHGRDDDVDTAVAVATAATTGAAALPEPLRVLCFALIESSLSDAARKSFAMLPQGQRFFSENQRRWFAEGKAEGEAKGRADGLRGAVMAALVARSIRLTELGRSRLDGCSDPEILTRWLTRAVTAVSEAEIFAPDDG